MATLANILAEVDYNIDKVHGMLEQYKKLQSMLPILKVGCLYEMGIFFAEENCGEVIVQCKGFVIAPETETVRELLIQIDFLARKGEQYSLSADFIYTEHISAIKAVDVSDLPLYVGWETTDLFKELMGG